jgi:hypothetical protein
MTDKSQWGAEKGRSYFKWSRHPYTVSTPATCYWTYSTDPFSLMVCGPLGGTFLTNNMCTPVTPLNRIWNVDGSNTGQATMANFWLPRFFPPGDNVKRPISVPISVLWHKAYRTMEGKYPRKLNPLTPELNPSAQRCMTRFFTGDFSSWTVHFVNICVKNQQMHQLFIQFINYVW